MAGALPAGNNQAPSAYVGASSPDVQLHSQSPHAMAVVFHHRSLLAAGFMLTCNKLESFTTECTGTTLATGWTSCTVSASAAG